MKLGDILRDLMEERNLTQKQLSADLHVAASTLGNYIRNLREPDYETLKRFAAYFHVSTDYLLDNRAAQAETRLEDELLRVFRSLTRDQQELYIAQGQAFVQQNNKKERSSRSDSEKGKRSRG
ncbi:MAG: helix-turn-helix domain-containing protein [Clostridiales Family XIII bacterium]|jgi:transcriptional regulator with XRE-family HTH domain|nr:helix-turn-helix domain-containing protein [Clostridiales Family XIII bacterium]